MIGFVELVIGMIKARGMVVMEAVWARVANCDPLADPSMIVFGGSSASGGAAADPAAVGDSSGESPRHVIRGDKSQHTKVGQFGEIGVGWWRLSFPVDQFREVLCLLVSYFGRPLRKGGMWGYTARWSWDNGAFLAYDDPEGHETVSSWCTAELQGDVLESMTPEELFNFKEEAKALGARGTRIDCSFDDFNWIITPEAVRAAFKQGQCVGYKTGGYHESGHAGEKQGCTATFGQRGNKGSGKYVRCYDKKEESGGRVDCVRWEVEFSGDFSKHAWEHIAETKTVEEMGVVVGALVGGAIDFRDRSSGDPNLSRLPRLEWWQQILEQIGRAPIRVEYPESTMPRKMSWIRRSVSKSLVMIRIYCEKAGRPFEEFMRSTYMLGRGRLTETDLTMITRELDRDGWRDRMPTRSAKSES